MRLGLAIGTLGLIGCIAGIFIDPARTLGAWLVAIVTIAGVPLGALGLLLVSHVIRADALVALRPRLGVLASALPFVALLFLPVALGTGSLYPWAGEEARTALAAGAATWLRRDFFVLRSALYFLVWTTLVVLAVRPAGTASGTTRTGTAAVGLLAYAATVPLAGVDWLMSLAAPWSSAAFGLHFLAGALVAALAALAILDAWPNAAGRLESTRRHALGSLLLTAVLFHAWVGFTQYYIVWIADLPSEVGWYLERTAGGWALLAAAVVLLHGVVPVTALLPRVVKRNVLLLGIVGVALIAARYADVYWTAGPSLPAPYPHLLDLAALLACSGLAVGLTGMRLAQ